MVYDFIPLGLLILFAEVNSDILFESRLTSNKHLTSTWKSWSGKYHQNSVKNLNHPSLKDMILAQVADPSYRFLLDTSN